MKRTVIWLAMALTVAGTTALLMTDVTERLLSVPLLLVLVGFGLILTAARLRLRRRRRRPTPATRPGQAADPEDPSGPRLFTHHPLR